jgi:hypothetical protein
MYCVFTCDSAKADVRVSAVAANTKSGKGARDKIGIPQLKGGALSFTGRSLAVKP